MNRALLGGLVLIVAASFAARVYANGGTLRLNKAVAGPYLVSAWSQPDPPRVGGIDVSVAVMQPLTGEAVLDAWAHLRAESIEGGRIARAVLERGGRGNRLLHHGELVIPSAGRWRFTVTAAGPKGRGQAAFELDVQPPATLARSLLMPVVVVLAAALGWLWVRAKRRQRPS